MSGGAAFRSQIMQQFAATARSQSRPPLALVRWVVDEDSSHLASSSSSISRSTRNHSSRSASTAQAPQSWGSSPFSSPQTTKHTAAPVVSASRFLSTSSASLSINNQDEDEEEWNEQSITFQNLIQTRRTTSRFDTSIAVDYMAALNRAVLCGQAAPNHKRTEAFRFKRIASPSPATNRLSDIAYHVASNSNKPAALERAAQKRNKWRQIPAFLVALVEQEQIQDDVLLTDTSTDEGDNHLYQPLPFVPPSTERDLEDYAAACAAVQNILLSLHSEDLGSKWATGPVIRTRAFRELVKAEPRDRVVGLIMVGAPGTDEKRRYRKPLDELLVDL